MKAAKEKASSGKRAGTGKRGETMRGHGSGICQVVGLSTQWVGGALDA